MLRGDGKTCASECSGSGDKRDLVQAGCGWSVEPGRVSLGLCEWALKASFSDLSLSASPHCGVPLVGKPQLRLSQESKAPSVKGVGPSPGLWDSIEVSLGRGEVPEKTSFPQPHNLSADGEVNSDDS